MQIRLCDAVLFWKDLHKEYHFMHNVLLYPTTSKIQQKDLSRQKHYIIFRIFIFKIWYGLNSDLYRTLLEDVHDFAG
jgi:hypothetical protein